MLSSTNFTCPILEYFFSFVMIDSQQGCNISFEYKDMLTKMILFGNI